MATTEKRDGSADTLSGTTPQPYEPNQNQSGALRSQDLAYAAESTDEEKGQHAPGDDPSPDGGVVAWLVVLGAWCTSFCSYGWINSVGAFQEYYMHSFLSGYSASTISWIPSLQIFFMSAMGPLVGILYDKFGPRYLIFFGSIMHVFGLMMLSLGGEYYQIMLAQGVCSAIGVAFIFQPSINCIHGWFDKNRGAAFGILATGSSIGGVIFPIMVTRLIENVGYAWSMRICAFMILGLLIIANLTVRQRHRPAPQKVTKALLAKPLRELDFMLLCSGFFCFTFGIFVPINYLPSQALSFGVEPNLVQYLVPILNAASLFGRLFSGFMGDRIGRYNIFVIVCFLTGIWVLALWIPSTTTGGIVAFSVLFGFCSGAYVSLIGPLVAQISPMAELGFRTGIIFFVAAIPGLTTNPIAGAILEKSGGWVGVQIFSGVFCLAGTILVFFARVRRTGWKLAAVF